MLVVLSGLASLFRALLILLASFECRRFYGDHLHDDDDDDDFGGDFGHDDDFDHELFLCCYSDDDALHSELPLPFAQKRFYSVQSNKRNDYDDDNDDDDNDDNSIRRYIPSLDVFFPAV